MKFWNLFKKELRELMTFQTLAGLLVGVLIFFLVGQLMGSIGEELTGKMGSVVIADQDQTKLTAELKEELRTAGFELFEVEGASDAEIAAKTADSDHSAALLLPAGFTTEFESGRSAEVLIVNRLTGFGMLTGMDSSASSAAEVLKQSLSARAAAAAGATDLEFLQNPVTPVDITVVGQTSEQVNADALRSFAMQQTIFIPLVVFILITFATQLNASAIANEKNDKTLETLLSAPVSRVSVLASKMCASGVLSLLMAAVYMIGFSSLMGGVMGGSGGTVENPVASSLANLGLQLGPAQYALVGLQLFLTIMIALAISMILGALAKDMKAANGLMMPLMFLSMIPYFVTIFADVSSLPVVGQVLMYLIPFTHTFTASANLLFGHMTVFYIGLAYQAVVLVGVMMFAVHVFSTDKIFTITLGGMKSRSRKKKA